MALLQDEAAVLLQDEDDELLLDEFGLEQFWLVVRSEVYVAGAGAQGVHLAGPARSGVFLPGAQIAQVIPRRRL